MSSIKPGVRNPMQCLHDDVCASARAGHAVSAIQERISAATPSKWRDGVVTSVSPDGWLAVQVTSGTRTSGFRAIGVDGLDGGRDIDAPVTVGVWHHSDLTGLVSAGEPVAVHSLYSTLAVGARRYSILRAPTG